MNTRYIDGLRTNSYFRNSYSTNDIIHSTIKNIQIDLEVLEGEKTVNEIASALIANKVTPAISNYL